MPQRARRRVLACAALAALAFAGALALASWRVLDAIRHTVEIVWNGRGAEAASASEVGAALLALASGGLLVGALALALAGRRAAQVLERASLIEIH